VKRSGFKPSKTPMKRSKMKSKRKPLTKIQAAAKDRECTIRLPGICNFRTDTTVLCHSNQHTDGKGMGLKAPDTCAAFGCSACHDVVDGRAPRPVGMSRDLMLAYFQAGIEQTQRILRRMGLVS